MLTYGEGYEEPKVIDDSTIMVTTKSLNWRLFLYFGAAMHIYPAKYVNISGEEFRKVYDWKYWPGSGPYMMHAKDLDKGNSITMTKRDDWWAKDERWATGLYNFHKIKLVTIRDQELMYEMFKRGDLDWFTVGRAQRWVEDIPKENVVKQGWVQARRVFNESPEGFQGLAFNTRKPPFNNKNVRKAFCYSLQPREAVQEAVLQPVRLHRLDLSRAATGATPRRTPRSASTRTRQRSCSTRPGYQERNDDGYLVGPDGKILEVTLEFSFAGYERIWLVVKEDYEKAGIKFNLKLIDGATLIKKVGDRQFDITFQPWTGLLFPNPETSFHSKLANEPQNNNITGFANKRVDELLDQVRHHVRTLQAEGDHAGDRPLGLCGAPLRVRLVRKLHAHPVLEPLRTPKELRAPHR